MAISEVEKSDRPDRPDWGPRGTAAATIAARFSFAGISHKFGGKQVLSDVSLELAPGEIICLLGPSGCGKTTLLRIGAGVERPTSGSVLLDGREVAGENVFVPPEKRSVGLMFQDFALFPHLTLLENILFGLKRLPKEQAGTEARAALKRVGMLSYEDHYPHMLSGGEQQRIALARAIAPRPAVMLMDEPFSGLDRRLRASVRDETLAVLKETRASALMVTHDSEEAFAMADRIALMRSGKIIQNGTPSELYNTPRSASVARMFSNFNEIVATVSSGKVTTPFGALPAQQLKDGTEALILIRPEAFLVKSKGGTKALVTNVRFMGESANVSLLVEGIDRQFTARFLDQKVPDPGAVISVAIDNSRVFVFAG